MINNIADDNTITLNRGEGFEININVFNKDDTNYTLKSGDKITFTVKKDVNSSEVILQKTGAKIKISGDDTETMTLGEYVYDVELTYASGRKDTFITPSKFVLIESMYKTRMMDYYPYVIRIIQDFQSIIHGEYPEFEFLVEAKDEVMNEAYLSTMGENRIKQWEQILNITVLPDSTLQDRRDTIIARIRGTGKLNTELINSIVNTFTEGTAESWVENSTLYVRITPPPYNKSYKFENVENEISRRVPAHLGFNIYRTYYTWGDVFNNNATWNDVKTKFETWNDVYYSIPIKV